MESVSYKNTANRANYQATKRGAVISAAACSGSLLACAGIIKSGIKLTLGNNPTIGYKKKFIKGFTKNLAGQIDFSKTTVSKTLKTFICQFTSPTILAKTAVLGAAIGAGIGLSVDFYRNNKAKRPGHLI
ncbi:MAG: hypothetical protein LUB59_07160 [Candidatus Gastranaerophilales bacterium]|nr:hypothetical protein [Candidatus Gastranaerophilales bacterium]